MRKASFAIILGFAFLIALAMLLTQSVAVMQRAAHLSNVAGEVKIVRKGEETARLLPADKRLVQAGDKLITGADGRLSLNWIDGTRIGMAPSSELMVQKCEVARGVERAVFRLDLGKIWIRVMRTLSQQDKFEIKTPTATAGVRGTIFAVAVTPDGTTDISVYEGEVTVASDGGEVKVAANNTVRLAAQTGPQVSPFSAQEAQAWAEQIGELGPYLEVTDVTFSDDTITVKGRTERDVELTVGGEAVTPKPNGRFTVDLDVPEEESPTVAAVATDRRGYTTTVRRLLVHANHTDLLAPTSE